MKKILFSIMAACAVFIASASEIVTLTVNGQGATKEKATANALRNAIEQTFGVFVSANTEILNDNLIKDEIATISSGNIEQYQELSCVSMPNGEVSITLSATVSIGKLIAYAKSHGSSAEFAGQAFAMNMKLQKLNQENEVQALNHMLKQLRELAPYCFDWDLSVGSPVVDGSAYLIPMQVTAKSNEASDAFYKTLLGTLGSLSLSDQEIAEYQRVGTPVYPFEIRSYNSMEKAWRPSMVAMSRMVENNEPQKLWRFTLRIPSENLLPKIENIIRSINSSFVIIEQSSTSYSHEFRDERVYENLYNEVKWDIRNGNKELYEFTKKRQEMATLKVPTMLNEANQEPQRIHSAGIAILNLRDYTIRTGKKKKQIEPTIIANKVFTHNVIVRVEGDRIATITGFEVSNKATSLAEFYYTLVSPWNEQGVAIVKASNTWGLVDKDANVIMAEQCDNIIPSGNDFIMSLNGKRTVLNSKGESITKDKAN